VALTNTLKFISACVLAGLICWIQPEVIGWACLVVVVVVLLIVNPF
jgi:hypothetical protein